MSPGASSQPAERTECDPDRNDDLMPIASQDPNPDTIDLVDAARVFFRNLPRITLFCVVSSAATVGLLKLFPEEFTAEATLLPPQESKTGAGLLSQFQGLASTIGLSAAVDADPSLLYSDILKSKRFLRDVAYGSSPSDSGILGWFELPAADSVRAFYAFCKLMAKNLSVEKMDNGIVRVKFTSRDSLVSSRTLNLLLREFEAFHRRTRITKAQENLEFIDGRLTEVKDSLLTWEGRLKTFRDRNLEIQNSADLQLQLRRLTREVAIHEEMFTLLKKEYEMARLQEQRDRPFITVLDYAEPPLKPTFPNILPSALAAAGVAFILGTLLVFFLDALSGRFPSAGRWISRKP